MSSVEQMGPWRLFEALGRGGMGVVYRAEHVATGQAAAVKTVVAAREGMLQGIRREILALAEIDHPGVVRVLDHGVQGGLPWYAMELLRGSTLRDRCARIARSVASSTGPTELATTRTFDEAHWTQDLDGLPDGPAAFDAPALPKAPAAGGDLPDVLRLAHALCGTLAWLHAEGIVHRDLKPDNVFLVDGERPVLVDFGLTSRFGGEAGRERLEAASGTALGTVDYIAPEQARGEIVDARADLYALGCILFELLVGRAPFVGGTPAQIVAQHLDAPPTPPSELVDGVPPALDALVMGLLAKEPHDRIGRADDVADALVALGVPAPIPAPRRAWLYRPALVGRREMHDRLLASLGPAAEGRGRLVLLGGESGVGKTRLAMEVAREARQRRWRVIVGESAEGGRVPLQALRPALVAMADRCREGGPQATLQAFGPGLRALAAFEPALADLPGFEAAERPPDLQAEAARDRLVSWVADALIAAAAGQPLLLVLDDLQWADDLTLAALERLARHRLAHAPLVILGTWRTEESTEGLARLRGLGDDLRLGRLDPDGVAAMVADMLALPAAPPKLVSALVAHSEGVPFYVAEFLRTAVAEGLLTRDAAGRWEVVAADAQALALPRALVDLVARRLEGLRPATREAVAVAAILGRTFDEALLTAVLGADPSAALRDALKRQVLEARDDGALAFVHDKVREAALASLPASRRVAFHGAAADALARRGGADHGALARIAEHRAAAGQADRARELYLRAARAAKAAHALQAAADLFAAGLEGLPPAERATIGIELGDALQTLGRLAEAQAVFARGVEDAEAAGDAHARVTHRVGVATSTRHLGQAAEGQAQLTLAAAEAAEAGDDAAMRLVLREQAAAWMDVGRLSEAITTYQDLLARYEAEGNLREVAVVLSNIGNAWTRMGETQAALAALRKAEALVAELDDPVLRTAVEAKLGLVIIDTGDSEAATRHLLAATALARATGQRRILGLATTLLGFVSWTVREYGEAERYYAEALDTARELGLARDEAAVLAHMADLSAQIGRVDEARERYLEAARIQRETTSPRMLAITLNYLATLERRAGRYAACGPLLDEADALLSRSGDRLRHALVYAERGHLALALGQDASEMLARVDTAYADAASLEGPWGRLSRAVAAAARGEPLHAGEIWAELPEAVRAGYAVSAARPAPASPPKGPR